MTRTALLLLLILLSASPADPGLLPTVPKRWYDAIRPRESELLWKQIPWMVDLEAAVTQARVEKRPLLLWVSGDDPLERC